MAWGLLQGIGRGLSQGAGLLQQGMSEDREAERQRLRDESIERRWKRQEQREDARNKIMDDRHAEQAKAQSSAAKQAQANADREFELRRDQLNQSGLLQRLGQIDSNFGGIMSAQEKSEAKITDKYTKLMSRDDITKEEFAALNQQFTDEIKQNRDYYSAKIEQLKVSYGDSLKGTGYEYLLHVKPETDPAGLTDDANPTAVQTTPFSNSAAERLAKIQEYMKSTTAGQALNQVATDYQNRFTKPTIGQKALSAGLLSVPAISDGLNVDDVGQFAAFVTTPKETAVNSLPQQPWAPGQLTPKVK